MITGDSLGVNSAGITRPALSRIVRHDAEIAVRARFAASLSPPRPKACHVEFARLWDRARHVTIALAWHPVVQTFRQTHVSSVKSHPDRDGSKPRLRSRP